MYTASWRSAVSTLVMLHLCVFPTSLPAQSDAASLRTLSDSAVATRLARLLQQNNPSLSSLVQSAKQEESETSRLMREALTQHIEHYSPPDSLTPVLAKEYLRSFTGDELRALYVFFASPLGEKYRAAQGSIIAASMRRSNELLEPHRAELQLRTEELMRRALTPP
jgi:hypothetical protein